MSSDDPLIDLEDARPSFGRGSDAIELVEEIAHYLKHGDVRWLEVGAGDGWNLRWILSKLRGSRGIQAVALEPASGLPYPQLEGVEWLCVPVEKYAPEKRFDWVNIRHSAYYFSDTAAEINRVADMLDDRGGISVTHWSRDCVLYRLHEAICNDSGICPVDAFEELMDKLATIGRLEIARTRLVANQLDREWLRHDLKTASALYNLALRGRPARRKPHAERAGFVIEFLDCLPDNIGRLNGISILRLAAPKSANSAPPR